MTGRRHNFTDSRTSTDGIHVYLVVISTGRYYNMHIRKHFVCVFCSFLSTYVCVCVFFFFGVYQKKNNKLTTDYVQIEAKTTEHYFTICNRPSIDGKQTNKKRPTNCMCVFCCFCNDFTNLYTTTECNCLLSI